MAAKMSWDEISKLYSQEWVELVDYDWPEEEMEPRAGIVRVHAQDRDEFYRLAAIDSPEDSALVFVGKQALPEGHVFSAGLRRAITDHA